ncbi:MAG: T9SS type A sorting domain-containing protein [Gemmatimonadetes bacterium]|nr:T9SS type A sorting domain-containing protein [Gemmatimonadota bacterium]
MVDNSSYGIQLQTAATVTFGSSLAEWNDIHDNGGVTPDRDFWNGTSSVLASYVYWGTTTEGAIQDRIHHQPDDGGLGLVTFSPWTNSTHDATFGGDPTGVVVSNLPTTFSLAQNRPNPVRGATSIRYALPRASRVDLSVYDVTGRKVATLVDGPQEAGFRETRWDASGVANGVYFYRLQTDGFTDSKRIVVIR